VVIERTAHLAALENPQAVNPLIERFLNEAKGFKPMALSRTESPII
jgi:hypothetical protein